MIKRTLIKRYTSIKQDNSLDEAILTNGISIISFLDKDKNLCELAQIQALSSGYDFNRRFYPTKKKLREDVVILLNKFGFKSLDSTNEPKKEIKESSKLDLDSDLEDIKPILTAKEFWRIIDEMNWIEDNNYERINKEFLSGKYGNEEKRKAIVEMYDKCIERLHKIGKMNEKKGISLAEPMGDDSFSDYLADIVGCGEKKYKYILKNKEKLFTEAGRSSESFTYALFLD